VLTAVSLHGVKWQRFETAYVSAGPLPQGVEALLLHSDNVAPPPVQLSLSAECPKVGISLELAEDWPTRTNSAPDTMFYHLEAAVRGISADIRPTGDSLASSQSQHAAYADPKFCQQDTCKAFC